MGKRGPQPGAKYRKTRVREVGQRRALQKAIARNELSAARVLEELRRVSFSDVGACLDADGNLKPLHELTAEERAAIGSVEVAIKNLAAGDGLVDRVVKVKLWDKLKALEMLAKHFNLLTEQLRLSGGIEITWKDSE